MSHKQIILLDYVTQSGGYFKHSTYHDIYAAWLDGLGLEYRHFLLHIDAQKANATLYNFFQEYLHQPSLLYFHNPWLRQDFFSLQQSFPDLFFLQSNKSQRYDRGSPSSLQSDNDKVLYFHELDADSFQKALQDAGIKIKNDGRGDNQELNKNQRNARRELLTPGKINATDKLRYLLTDFPSCGYTITVKNNAEFSDVTMPPDILDKGGCSFCRLDPLPQKTNRDYKNDIQQAIAQIENTLQNNLQGNDQIGGFISEDQFFLNYLEEILTHLKNGIYLHTPLQFYIVTRAVYVNNFEETIRRNLQHLVGTNYKIVMHLIGFENFSQKQLDIFNKGTKVNATLKCLQILQQLEKEFPQYFQATTGSHGFILFTPWISFQELQENLRRARELRFINYSGNYYLRKLRLSQDVPLYYKAKQEGLLDSEHSRSTAVYHAYEKDIPWKFRDAQSELVYKLNHKFHYFSGMNKDDIFEASTALVKSSEKENVCRFDENISCVFHRECLQSSHTLPGSKEIFTINTINGKIKNVSELELVGLQCGQRKLVKFEGSPTRKIEDYRDEVEKKYHGYQQAIFQESEGPLFIAQDKIFLDQAIELEKKLRANDNYSQNADSMGELLGYPPCCRQQYSRQYTFTERQALSDTATRLALLHKAHQFVCPLIGYLNVVLSYFPCSLDCKNSITKAQIILSNFLQKHYLQDEKLSLLYVLNRKLLYISEQQYIYFFADLYLPQSPIIFSEACGFSEQEMTLLRRANYISIDDRQFHFKIDDEIIFSFDKNQSFLLHPGELRLNTLNAFNKQNYLSVDTKLFELHSLLQKSKLNIDELQLKNDGIEVNSDLSKIKIFITLRNDKPYFKKLHFYQISYQGNSLTDEQSKILQSLSDLVESYEKGLTQS